MDRQSPVSRITTLIMKKGSRSQDQAMPEDSIISSPLSSSSRSNTLGIHSRSMTSTFEVVNPSILGSEIVSSQDSADFDVWFVHGLTGNRRETWTHKDTGTFCPQLIADDFPEARVITYGYDADVIKFAKVWGNASTESLKSYGQGLAAELRRLLQKENPRPVYFVPHSLGGLVVEQALLECIGSDRSLHFIIPLVAGVMFMGTPHQGSHLAKWGYTLQKLIPSMVRTTNKNAIELLKKDSKICQDLEETFQQAAKHGRLKKIKLFCFFETKVMTGLRKHIVPEKSAVLKADFKMAIERTHTEMTRFTGPEDPEYCKVKGQLESWLRPESDEKVVRKQRRRNDSGINMTGATFSGPMRGASIFAPTTSAIGDVFMQNGVKHKMKFGRRDEEEDESETSSEASSDEEDDVVYTSEEEDVR